MKRSRFDLSTSIIFQNKDYLLINKPPFISTLEDRNDEVNVLSLLRKEYPEAQVGHRLDKETSGVLAVALNPEAYRNISMQLEHREVRKVYHAVVEGSRDFADLLVDAPILKQADGRVKISRDGKPAETWFTTLEHYRGFTLVECRPVTGRMHQIRVHLAKLEAPIAGDSQYGGNPVFLSRIKKGYNLKKDTEEEPLMKRVALHAFSMEFLGLGGEKLKAQAPYPKDFRVLLKQLAEHGR